MGILGEDGDIGVGTLGEYGNIEWGHWSEDETLYGDIGVRMRH